MGTEGGGAIADGSGEDEGIGEEVEFCGFSSVWAGRVVVDVVSLLG